MLCLLWILVIHTHREERLVIHTHREDRLTTVTHKDSPQ